MTAILIREVGPYAITTDSEVGEVYCNGARVNVARPPAGSSLAMLVETHQRGSNGKPDFVGLNAEQWGVYTANLAAIRARREAEAAAARAADREAHAAYFAERDRLAALAEAYDRTHNEGAAGYNPHRAALDALDRANGRATDADMRAVRKGMPL